MTALAQSLPTRDAEAASLATTRDASLDALRATLTLLVLFHHSAITYGAIGGWYYREVPTDGRLETTLLILFCSVNQAYFMGLFFLLAGYFTPAAVARHGDWGYLKDRLLRLGLPLLVYGFLIGPFTIALAETSRGGPFGATLLHLWARGTFENGPLWFTQALLNFAVGFLVWRALALRLTATRAAAMPLRPFPSNFVLVLAVLVTGAVAFALRLIWPVGVNVAGLQLGYFSSYVVLFAAGCLGASAHWLRNVPARQQRIWLVVALIALPVMPAVVWAAPYLPILKGRTEGGWNIQAVVYAFWEPLVAWGIILTLLRVFEHRVMAPGPIWVALSRRAYVIYIIHPPILVAIALAWRGVAAPHLVKFAVTGAATCLLCFLIAGWLLRVPAIRKVV